MVAAIRRTPTQAGGGSDDGVLYTNAVSVEVEALWRYAGYPLTSVAGTNAITAASDTAVVGAITAYATGMKRSLIPAVTNTGGVTINIDSVGVVDLKDADGATLGAGDLVASRMYGIEYDGTAWRVVAGGLSAAAQAFSVAPDLILRDEKAQNTAGGAATSGSWFTRTLNTVVRNTLAGASLSANQFTLQPGTYRVQASAPAGVCNSHQVRLYNVTDAAMVSKSEGTSEQIDNAAVAQTRSFLDVVFTITSAKVFQLEHQVETTRATDGQGVPANFTTEVYAVVYVWKVGTLASEVDGVAGGAVTWPVTFSTTTTDADPGDGKFRLNNATQTSATAIYIDLLDADLTDVSAVIDSLDDSTNAVKGECRLVKYDDPTKWLTFNVTAWTTASGYRKLTVVNLAGSAASPLADLDRCYFTFTRAGHKGDTGSQGADAGDIPWNFDTSTSMADPGTGDVRLNNATLASVTAIAISASSAASGNPAVGPWVLAWDDLGTAAARGYLVIRKTSAPQNYAIYKVTGSVTDNTTWMQLAVTHVSSAGSFSNTDGLSVQFTPAATDSGALVLIETQTPSGATNSDFSTGIDDTYDDYLIIYDLTVNTDDVELHLQIGTPTIQTANYSYRTTAVNTSGDISAASASAAHILLTSASATGKIGSAAGENAQGSIWFGNPESTSNFRLFTFAGAYTCATGIICSVQGAGSYNVAGTAVSALRFKTSSGTHTGRISLYGIKKS